MASSFSMLSVIAGNRETFQGIRIFFVERFFEVGLSVLKLRFGIGSEDLKMGI